MLAKSQDEVVVGSGLVLGATATAGTSIADLAYAAELDRRRLFRYARMLLATNSTATNATTPSSSNSTTNATATNATTSASSSNTTTTNATTPAAGAPTTPAAAPAADAGLMNSPAAGAAIGGGAASAVGGIVGKFKAKLEKIKEVKAKLVPKLEKSKELATKIAKEVPKVAQAQAGKLQALQEEMQADMDNLKPPEEMKDPEKIAAWKDEKMDRIKAEGARTKTEIMVGLIKQRLSRLCAAPFSFLFSVPFFSPFFLFLFSSSTADPCHRALTCKARRFAVGSTHSLAHSTARLKLNVSRKSTRMN